MRFEGLKGEYRFRGTYAESRVHFMNSGRICYVMLEDVTLAGEHNVRADHTWVKSEELYLGAVPGMTVEFTADVEPYDKLSVDKNGKKSWWRQPMNIDNGLANIRDLVISEEGIDVQGNQT